MGRLITTNELLPGRTTPDALRWAKDRGRVQSVGKGVYLTGTEAPTALDHERATVLRSTREARGHLAGVLHRLDSVVLDGRPLRRDRLPDERVIIRGGVRCADGLATLVDLAASLDDLTWEQALESALRKRLTTVAAIEAELPVLGASRVPGTARIRRVLALRLPGAPATESLLETLMVQLGRGIEGLGDFVRQHEVWDGDILIARLDLARPDIGYFLELDGEGHKGQPVYDAIRQTAVVTATGMLVGRFTWTEVTRFPNSTRRRLAALHARASRR
jgi:very-short-patch-repair endonuclease